MKAYAFSRLGVIHTDVNWPKNASVPKLYPTEEAAERKIAMEMRFHNGHFRYPDAKISQWVEPKRKLTRADFKIFKVNVFFDR